MAFVDPRAAAWLGDCGDSMPSSTASEDTLEIGEADVSLVRLQNAVHSLLSGIGEDVCREGLRDTPKASFAEISPESDKIENVIQQLMHAILQRVAKAWIDATEGYRQSTHRYGACPSKADIAENN